MNNETPENRRKRWIAEVQQNMKAIHNRVDKRIGKNFVNLLTQFFKLKVSTDKLAYNLALYDRSGADKTKQVYRDRVAQIKTQMEAQQMWKDMFNAYLSIGEKREYKGKFINDDPPWNLLDKMYNAELSGLIPSEEWKKSIENFEWRGISDEEFEVVKNNLSHVPQSFISPAYIFKYMKQRQIVDYFISKYPKEPTTQEEIIDYNRDLPKFTEIIARCNSMKTSFKDIFNRAILSDYPRGDKLYIDEMYTIEVSGDIEEKFTAALPEEEEEVRRALNQLPIPVAGESSIFGGTRRRRKNRKSTRRHRRN